MHEHAGGAELSKAIRESSRKFYGAVFRAFINNLITREHDDVKGYYNLIYKELTADVPENAHGSVSRVAAHFALIATGGELATQYHLTGWEDGAAIWAAKVCMAEWIKSRGGYGSQETKSILEQIRHFLEVHEEDRFSQDWCNTCKGNKVYRFPILDDDDKPTGAFGKDTCKECGGKGFPDRSKTVNKAGYLAIINGEQYFMVTPQAFKQDICAGIRYQTAEKTLIERDLLIRGDGNHKLTKWTPRREKGGEIPEDEKSRFYKIRKDSNKWNLD